jgi:hypothetical protein
MKRLICPVSVELRQFCGSPRSQTAVLEAGSLCVNCLTTCSCTRCQAKRVRKLEASYAGMAESKVLISWDPHEYLNSTELSRLDEQFDAALADTSCLVFWTSVPRAVV